jgi:hypothetical protein
MPAPAVLADVGINAPKNVLPAPSEEAAAREMRVESGEPDHRDAEAGLPA